jgi:hypothetical protein
MAQKSARIYAAEQITRDCPGTLEADIASLTGEQRHKMLMCHFANLDLHNACFGPGGKSVQEWLTPAGEASCNKIAMYVDMREMLAVLPQIKQILSGTLDASLKFVKETELSSFNFGTLKDLVSEGSSAAFKIKTAGSQTPQFKAAINLMYYGSESISTCAVSARVLDTLEPVELAKISAEYYATVSKITATEALKKAASASYEGVKEGAKSKIIGVYEWLTDY